MLEEKAIAETPAVTEDQAQESRWQSAGQESKTKQPVPGMMRERSFGWSDPVALADQASQLSGLDMFQKMIRREIDGPPIAHTLGFRMQSAEKGRVVFVMQPQEFHYNPIGSMHGGVISTLLDSAMGCAVHSTLKAGTAYTSLELKVNFIRPITVDSGVIECEGVQIAGGRSTAVAEGRIRDSRGRILAYGSTTCIIFRGAA